MGKSIDACIASRDKKIFREALSFTDRVSEGSRVSSAETVRYTKEGRAVHVLVSGAPIIIDGVFEGIVATYTEITELKEKERKVETLLREKEELLREVHHRIKNHMNTISSLISLRRGDVADSQTRDILEEILTKMRLMQNIYQTLYSNDDMGLIHVSTFIDQLVEDIRCAYLDDKQNISIHTKIENLVLTPKQSLPVGIITTELITNSLKYAFEERTHKKEIHLSMYREHAEGHRVYLCIDLYDTGKGMPPEIVEDGQYGFGLTLVEGYAKQFDGTMDIASNEGSFVQVKLELEEV